jgi:hypothetical protein
MQNIRYGSIGEPRNRLKRIASLDGPEVNIARDEASKLPDLSLHLKR